MEDVPTSVFNTMNWNKSTIIKASVAPPLLIHEAYNGNGVSKCLCIQAVSRRVEDWHCSAPYPRESCGQNDNENEPAVAAVPVKLHDGTRLRIPDINDNISDTNNRSSINSMAPSTSYNCANFSTRRIRTRRPNDALQFDREQNCLDSRTGEFSFLFERQNQLQHDGSSLFSGSLSPLPQTQVGAQRFDLDTGMEHYYDEALNFVASRRMREKRSEICADFVREHFKCPICLDVLINSTALICGHRFCKPCIDSWLKVRSNCPICQIRGTTQVPQYSDDIAITSVAELMSSEWQRRRQLVTGYREHSTASSPSITAAIFPFKWAQDVEVLFRNGRRYCSRNGTRWWRSTQNNAFQIWGNLTLKDVAVGVLIGSAFVVFLSMADEIVNFVQYMFYVIFNYDKRIPITRQIEELEKRKGKVIKGERMYQEFAGGSDTIFAHFIRLFYAS